MNATLTLSSNVAYRSTGTNSMRVDISVPANAWQTTVLNTQPLPAPIAISPTQYITLRIAGDPQYTNSTFNALYVYAWDGNGNFGRWGSAVPTTTTDWQVFNFPASPVDVPWNSPGAPDLNNIVRFRFYLYGQNGAPDPTNAFTATIYIDELQVRNAPLIEFPPPSPMRAKIDNFEGYADSTALLGFYPGGPGDLRRVDQAPGQLQPVLERSSRGYWQPRAMAGAGGRLDGNSRFHSTLWLLRR